MVEEFVKCGDYREGLARIKCLNPECNHDYFVPLSCKGFYLCPSCHQKRTLLFGEQIAEDVLLKLPHRQFVFTFPKALRVFFKHDRLLFSDISNLIFDMIQVYYNEASGKKIKTGMILSYQTSGDFARWNPHFHTLLIEGGFDNDGNFVYLPISSTVRMTELFRRLVIKHFQDKKLINDDFAQNLLSWKNSGFSIDNSVMIYGNDDKTKESLAQYIARCPISLEKIKYESFHGKVLFKTPKYNDYFKENFKSFDVLDFIAEVTVHIPPKHKEYIRRYGVYSSRTRGIWERGRSVYFGFLSGCFQEILAGFEANWTQSVIFFRFFRILDAFLVILPFFLHVSFKDLARIYRFYYHLKRKENQLGRGL